jgi:transposase
VARARETWWTDPDGVGGVAPERLVFLDECGVLTTMARLHGRSPRGTRAPGSAPFGHWTRVTVLGALGAEGTVGAMGVEAATSTTVFHAHLDEVPLPELRRTKPDAVPVMDTLPAHKAPKVRALLDASGFGYRCLPAYSPDLNPIEPAWAKVKAELPASPPGPWTRCTKHSARPWAPSPRNTPQGSSATAATAVPASPQNALAAKAWPTSRRGSAACASTCCPVC